MLCGASDLRLYHDQGYRRLAYCPGCGVVYVHPMPSREEKHRIEQLAYEGDLLPEVADFFRNCHRNFKEDPVIRGFRHGLEWVGQQCRPGRILDVGPGTGIFLHLAHKEFGWEPCGIDVCQESADKALTEFDLRIDVGDFETFDYEPGSFDCISMLDVLEHAVDPPGFLKRAYELLRPGGVLYVAVPNEHCLMTVILGCYIRMHGPLSKFCLDRLYVPPHVFYFKPSTLTLAMRNAGFEVTGLKGGNVYLGRYRLPLWMRAPMEVVLQVGSLVGMGAKLLAIGRKPDVSD